MLNKFDIDVDFLDRTAALRLFKHHVASRIEDGKFVKHASGIYIQNIPHDLRNNLSTIEYATAEQRGYFKIDFLNAHVYSGIRDNEHLAELMKKEPLWELLIEKEVVDVLFHISGHIDILKQMRPTSVVQLAAVLAMIRPAKRYLAGKDWSQVMAEVWIPPTDNTYYFKASHAISYAVAIVVQLNLLIEQLSDPSN